MLREAESKVQTLRATAGVVARKYGTTLKFDGATPRMVARETAAYRAPTGHDRSRAGPAPEQGLAGSRDLLITEPMKGRRGLEVNCCA